MKEFNVNKGISKSQVVLNLFSESKEHPFSGVDVIQVLQDNPDLFELPKDKKFWDMSLEHYLDLVKKKGRVKIEGALLALRILNANDDPDVSKKAEDIRLKLKDKLGW